MALDRQSIEKKDFPVGRRGYDPEAVDSHLSSLADEIADLKRSARRRSDTLASSASEQVRAIVEAAESSAADIQRDAENEAREIRDEANAEAQATREQATEQAREYVGSVSESTDTMLKRLDAMETELGSLIESLRTGGNRLTADLKLLESNLTEVSGAVTPRPRFEPEEPEPAAAPETETTSETTSETEAESETEAALTPESEAGSESGATPESEAAVAGTESAPEGEGAPAAPASEAATNGEVAGAGGEADTEGARLIALNMALNGTPREETARYLSENFSLPDAAGLLDEVYASVQG